VITLQELLESRDKRAARQGELLRQYPGRALVCLTVQLPGPEKRNVSSLKIAAAAVEAIEKSFGPEYKELRDLETGFEGYFIVPESPLEAKKKAVEIEETHPLGRLMDIDVPGMDRASAGLPPRKCLLCNNEVRYCMRAKTHTREELLKKIEELCEAY